MLLEYQPPVFSPVDEAVFNELVLRDHPLRLALEAIDFARLRSMAAESYSADRGRPTIEPVLMIKLEMLMYRDRLSDRQVIEHARTDMAYRYFLGLSLTDKLPDPSSLSYFRARLGPDGFRKLFNEVVAQAREQGLLKNRLRITDATHVIADVALPATLQLVAQARNRLLAAAEPFDPCRVAGERLRVEALRTSTQDAPADQRLSARVTHVREILQWTDALGAPADAVENRAWQQLLAARDLVRKILGEHDDPDRGDRTRSVSDPDARRGKHGEFFDGFKASLLLDPDSEIITAINVLPANGDEAANIVTLVKQEQAAHGHDVPLLSIDGIGFDGPVLRELQDPTGLNLQVIVPPKAEPVSELFGPEAFPRDASGEAVTCPAGQTSHYRQRDEGRHVTMYRFEAATCSGCPLLSQCMAKAPEKFGRTVRKNDYEAEYRRVRETAQTELYAAVRREHPKVERKHAEMVRRHGSRRARYRGGIKVECQMILTALVVNVKRITNLLFGAGLARRDAG